jgi:hypothetical protein
VLRLVHPHLARKPLAVLDACLPAIEWNQRRTFGLQETERLAVTLGPGELDNLYLAARPVRPDRDRLIGHGGRDTRDRRDAWDTWDTWDERDSRDVQLLILSHYPPCCLTPVGHLVPHAVPHDEAIKNAIKNNTNKELIGVIGSIKWLTEFKRKIAEDRLDELDEWEKQHVRMILSKIRNDDHNIVVFPPSDRTH